MLSGRLTRILLPAAAFTMVVHLAGATAHAAAATPSRELEQYEPAPMPPGFQVLNNELEGNIFADAAGMTLYTWPFRNLRNGETGDQIGKPACSFKKTTESEGLMEPYPGGFTLPDLDKRRSCAEQYPPVFAADDAKPVGQWSIVSRPEGRKQWAYGGYPLYTSVDDKKPTDVLGGSKRRGPYGIRVPVGPAPQLPPGFAVLQTVNGRLLTTDRGASVYASDRDRAGKSNCDAECARLWKPVTASVFAESKGEWSVVEIYSGVKQWAFRGKLLYTYIEESEDTRGGMTGSDVPGWRNVYTQQVAPLPSDFTLHDTPHGVTVADSRGHTVYVYKCTEDVADQFSCEMPQAPQQFRMAICGRGDPEKCLQNFPYVRATDGAKNTSTLWQAILINTHTGRLAMPGEEHALRVWAYRGRPVYTFWRDREPGDFEAHGWGEDEGDRNGYYAFLVRDDFFAAER